MIWGYILKTAAVTAAALGGTSFVVPALGFTSAGIAAKSLAAAFQSYFLGGTIASGSAFSILQSVGAAGLATNTKIAVGVVSGFLVKLFLQDVEKSEKRTDANLRLSLETINDTLTALQYVNIVLQEICFNPKTADTQVCEAQSEAQAYEEQRL